MLTGLCKSSCFRWGCCSDDGLVRFGVLTPRMITRCKKGVGHCVTVEQSLL